MSEVQEKLFAIVAEELNKPREMLTLEKHLVDDLNADSLDIAQIQMKIEDEFGISIPEDANIMTLGEAVKYVEAELTKEK